MKSPAKSPWWKEFLWWFLLGIPGAFVFFSSVSVEQATSNIAGWLEFFGVDRIPQLFREKAADAILRLVGIAGFAIFFWYRVPKLLANRKPRD